MIKDKFMQQVDYVGNEILKKIGAPNTSVSIKILFLGGGELAKEMAIELQRFGVEVWVFDTYESAPAMHVATHHEVIDLSDAVQLHKAIIQLRPDIIVPEIESVDVKVLSELSNKDKFNIIPSLHAVNTCNDRERLKELMSNEVGIKTVPYKFAKSSDELEKAIKEVGPKVVIKPVFSSSGKGQTVLDTTGKDTESLEYKQEIEKAFEYSQSNARRASEKHKVVVEKYIDFDYEITIIAIRHKDGVTILDPIGHRQVDGDYIESWQPEPLEISTYNKARSIVTIAADVLSGWGVFAVEFFVKNGEILFNEIASRPHDTGMVTMISQYQSQFALFARAILGLSIPKRVEAVPSASYAIIAKGNGIPIICDVDKALRSANVDVRLFGKPCVEGSRRIGVILAQGSSTKKARENAEAALSQMKVAFQDSKISTKITIPKKFFMG